MSTSYHVYTSPSAGAPIDYTTPVATVTGTTWTSAPLASSGSWGFAVRAFDTATGLEEQNLDAAVTIVLGSGGADITDRPAAPFGFRAFATAGAGIRVEWMYPPTSGPTTPTGFHVYIGTGRTPDYSTPAATVAFNTGILSTFVANINSLSSGTTYAIGVRAYNASGIETNTSTASVTADATGPAAVSSLAASAVV